MASPQTSDNTLPKPELSEDRFQRLMRILKYEAKDLQDFLDFTLNEAIDLSKSKIGYIYHYSESAKQFTLNSWSREVMQECTIRDPQIIYDLDKTGIWGEAVRQRKPIILNDYQAPHPLKKGYPEGHSLLSRFLTVPVFDQKEIVAVVGLANKAAEYTEEDIKQLELFMAAAWLIVKQKKAQHLLNERFKELQAFYTFSKIIDSEDITLEAIYGEMSKVLPKSWQYPEISCCRITINNNEYISDNFKVSDWMQSAPIKVKNSVIGKIEIGLLERKPDIDEGPFMKEERLLLDSIAERLGKTTERFRMEQELRKTNEYMTGRETKMIELKKEIEELKAKLENK
jgi:GAF domain-containing protein